MSEQDQVTTENSAEERDLETMTPEEQEKVVLMERAKQLGLNPHPNIGLDKLRQRVNDAIEGKDSDVKENPEEVTEGTATNQPKLSEAAKKAQLRKDALRLVRVKIVNMNPAQTSLEGDLFTFSNGVIGSVKRYVPFNTEWHVENVIYKMLKDKKTTVFVKGKNENGQSTVKAKQINAYSIELLPALTKKQLDELARRQALSGSIDNEED